MLSRFFYVSHYPSAMCQVHDFLEESSDPETQDCAIDGSGSSSDRLSFHRQLQIGTLDEGDIEFLKNRKKLRDAMLAVEDLNFGEDIVTRPSTFIINERLFDTHLHHSVAVQ